MVSPVNLHFLSKQNHVLQALGTPAWLWLTVHSCHKGRLTSLHLIWVFRVVFYSVPRLLTQTGDGGKIKVAGPAIVPHSSHHFSAQVGALWFHSSYTVRSLQVQEVFLHHFTSVLTERRSQIYYYFICKCLLSCVTFWGTLTFLLLSSVVNITVLPKTGR